MKIFVPVKRVPDYHAKVKIRPDGSGLISEDTKWIVNPFDEIAVEEALRIKESGKATEVVVVGIGPADVSTQLRYAMAMGADSAVLVLYEGTIDSDLASRVLVEIYRRGDYGLIVMGKQAIDSDCNQTGQLLASRLNLPQACFASKIVLDGSHATVTREVDGGLETIKISTPCLITTDLRLNEPRYAPLPGIMKAKKKPLTEIKFEELGIDGQCKVRVHKLNPPAGRQAGKKVPTVEELFSALKNEVKAF